MEFEKVIYEKDGNRATVTLNYPEKLNVWNFKGGMTDGFCAALDEAEEDDEIKVVVIKGAGTSFSAGHNLEEVGHVYGMGTGKPGERRPSQRIRLKLDRMIFGEFHRRMLLFPKVTIAQLHGYALGDGIDIALLCDMAVAAEDAQIGWTAQRLGFGGASPALTNLIFSVGWKRAIELVMTGRLLSGKEAAEIGLVCKAVPRDKLDEEVDKLAKAVMLQPRDGIALGKAYRELVYDSLGLTRSPTMFYIMHTLGTNLRWEPDEYSFFKERRDKGARTAFHKRDERYEGLVE